MARSVEDCAIMLQVLAGYDTKDNASTNVPVPNFQAGMKDGIKVLRIAVPRKN